MIIKIYYLLDKGEILDFLYNIKYIKYIKYIYNKYYIFV